MMKRTASPLASSLLVVAAALALPGCADGGTDDVAPDAAAPAAIKLPPSLEVQSTLALAAPPPEIADLLATLTAATTGPDAPSRYLVDLAVAQLPEGDVRWVAELLAPSLAAYVQARLDDIAPRLAPGLRDLADGLADLATGFGTREALAIDARGRATRTVTGVVVRGRVLRLAPVSAPTEVTLETLTSIDGVDHRLRIDEHALTLDGAALLRRGLTEGVIPTVVPGATDLAGALAALVDCPRLGAALHAAVGLGTPGTYAAACELGLGAAAAQLEARLPRVLALTLTLRGSARAIDSDRDGEIDTLAGGTWDGLGADGDFIGSRP